MFRKTGAVAVNLSSSIYQFCIMVGTIATTVPYFIAHPKKATRYSVSELYRCGPKNLPIICIVAFLFGTVIVAIAGGQFQAFGSEIFVANLIGISLGRELATLITSICLLFLVSARFTDDLANVRALDKDIYTLCLARVIVLFFVTPILSLFAFYAALLGGGITAQEQFNINWYQYWNQIFTVVPIQDLLLGLFKAMIFGIEIALIGCFYGIICNRKHRKLGKAIISSISMGILFIALTDSLIELTLYLL